MAHTATHTATQLPPRDTAVEAKPQREAPVPAAQPQRRRLGLFLWAFFLGALTVAGAVLVAANTGSIELDWVFGTTQTSLVWVLLGAVGLGWLLGLTMRAGLRRRTRRV